jgi:hypothetical protein
MSFIGINNKCKECPKCPQYHKNGGNCIGSFKVKCEAFETKYRGKKEVKNENI